MQQVVSRKSKPKAPFGFQALRPFVSVTLHRIVPAPARAAKADTENPEIAEELESKLESLLETFDIHGVNPLKISTGEKDRAILPVWNDPSGLSFTGLWFKRITAPPWFDAAWGPSSVADVTNHILVVAVRQPYLAVLGTHDKSRMLLSDGLEQGDCGKRQLSFFAPALEEEVLERAFIRGEARVSWLAGLHPPIATKPDAKTLTGRDLRHVFEPFSDQTFTLTSVISVLPALARIRRPVYLFEKNPQKAKDHANFRFRVGVAPDQRRVWTLHASQFNHFVEELHVLFDTLDLPADRNVIGDWGPHQEGFRFLGRPIAVAGLAEVKQAFDIGLDLPPPVFPGEDDKVLPEREWYRELWRVHGQLTVVEAGDDARCKAELRYAGEPVAVLDVSARPGPGGTVEVSARPPSGLTAFHEGVTCFETLRQDPGVQLTIRYDSGHVIRGSRLFHLGWQDVLFESWEWCFKPLRDGLTFSAAKEKPDPEKRGEMPNRKRGLGWEAELGVRIASPGSLFEYLVKHVRELFTPPADAEWHLCCDDGPGEVADFVYFEPAAGRLYLIHIKGADSDSPGRGLSVKAYEEVVSQATKNLRYLEIGNLHSLLRKGEKLPVAQTCFRNGVTVPLGTRDEILRALSGHRRRLSDKRVIVFQPHVRKSIWEASCLDWMNGAKPDPKNQINRLLQLRTLLADAEVTCRKIGARFEVWGEDDT